MKLAVVVQRYGAALNGGAELHARYVAEHLARHVEVEVLTTCAQDYITWANTLPPGTDEVNGVTIHRFPVVRQRNPDDFGRRSTRVFEKVHSLADELGWLNSEGPTCPSLVRYLRSSQTDYDYFIFFSYRYYHAYHGVRTVAPKAVLVPTAERDAALGLALFPPIFRSARAVMYNSHEERAMIHAVTSNQDVPGIVVGIGSEVPSHADSDRFRARHQITRPFALYVGRIDANKGCADLFANFGRYAKTSGGLDLVLVGNPVMSIPSHPRIHHLGFVSEDDKYDALAAADVLIMPSYYESLSMVTLEAWAMGVPVLVNGACDVLRGQVIRSNAGLYYTSTEEFVEALRVLAGTSILRQQMGRNGHAYFHKHYAWPIIERKYLNMLEQLRLEDETGESRRLEPLPGWLARRRRAVPAAADVMETIPSGPVLPDHRTDRHAEQSRVDRQAS